MDLVGFADLESSRESALGLLLLVCWLLGLLEDLLARLPSGARCACAAGFAEAGSAARAGAARAGTQPVQRIRKEAQQPASQ